MIDAGDVTLDDYVTGTWATSHALALGFKTAKVYAAHYDKHVRPQLGVVRLRALTPDVLSGWHAGLLAAGVGEQAVRKARVMLSSVLKRATESRLVPYNAARVMRTARVPQSREVRPSPRSRSRRCAPSSRSATLSWSPARLRRAAPSGAARAALGARARPRARGGRSQDREPSHGSAARAAGARPARVEARQRQAG
jgi:hypothetical protein